jgi:threonine/homoserine efflux transporter RhtA
VWLVGRVRAQAVGVLGYIEPVSAALLAWAILGEAVTWGSRSAAGWCSRRACSSSCAIPPSRRR